MGKMSRQWQRERMRRKRASIKWERACWEVAREYQREGNLKHMRKALQGLVKMGSVLFVRCRKKFVFSNRLLAG